MCRDILYPTVNAYFNANNACSHAYASSGTAMYAYFSCNGGVLGVLVSVFTFNTLCKLKSCYFDVSDH